MKNLKLKLVEVKWIDAYSDGGWHDRDSAIKDAKVRDLTCHTVGWIIDEQKDYLLVAGSLGVGGKTDGQVGDVFHVQKSFIQEIIPLVPSSKI